MRMLLRLLGLVAFFAGLFFAGQGAGYIHWPIQSMMIHQTRWIYYGGVIAIAGLLLLIAMPQKRRDTPK